MRYSTAWVNSGKGKLLAAAVILALAGGVAVAPPASAATPSCGPACVDLYNTSLGTQFILDASNQGQATGTPVNLAQASNTNPGEDFTLETPNLVYDFWQAGLASTALYQNYGQDYATELQYAPYGAPTGECVGIPSAPTAGMLVDLEPCGVSGKTLWVFVPQSSPSGPYALVSGADTSFPNPYVLTSAPSGQQLDITPLQTSAGFAVPKQEWNSATSGQLPTGACTTTITGTHATQLAVTSGETCLDYATQNGQVTVGSGASLSVVNSTVNGTVTATGAAGTDIPPGPGEAGITYCGSKQSGTLNITGTTGGVTLGDGNTCTADTIPSIVTVSGTSGVVSIVGLKENGDLTLSGNAGGMLLYENNLSGLVNVANNIGAAQDVLAGNTINGSLSCTGNSPAPVDADVPDYGITATINTVTGTTTGQCKPIAQQ